MIMHILLSWFFLLKTAMAASCGGILSGNTGIINGTVFPTNVTICSWEINVPTGYVIELLFNSFQFNDDCDTTPGDICNFRNAAPPATGCNSSLKVTDRFVMVEPSKLYCKDKTDALNRVPGVNAIRSSGNSITLTMLRASTSTSMFLATWRAVTPAVQACVPLIVQTTDAVTGEAIPDALVSVCQTRSTGNNGSMNIGCFYPGQNVTIRASSDGYSNFSQTYMVGNSTDPQVISIAMSPINGDFGRVVLSWGSTHRDLDLHTRWYAPADSRCTCFSPSPFSSYDDNCHVYYGQKECGVARLDWDNLGWGNEGPETLTWTMADNNKYMVYVHNYGESAPLSLSWAKLTVYSSPTRVFDVPTTGNSTDVYWILGCFNGQAGLRSINVVNILTSMNPAYNPPPC